MVDRREQLRAAVGAALGVLVAGLLCRAFGAPMGWAPWLVAPIGASAVLVFALPASPLAQPWPVIGGNTLSACVGMAIGALVPDLAVAGALAVGLAIGAMFLLRCLHPPGGAMALLVVLSQTVSWRYPLFPVLLDSALLVLAGAAYNRLTGRDYPHAAVAAVPPPAARFTTADIDAAMARYGQVLDLGRDDLAVLLETAEAHAYGRRLGSLRCADVMSQELVVATPQMPLREAWRLLRQRHVKALPVIDASRRLVGIVTVSDFLRRANLDLQEGLVDRLKALLAAVPGSGGGMPTVVGDIMTHQVGLALADEPVTRLLALFAEAGHHHVPVVDAEHRLCGIVTPADLMRTVLHAPG